MDVHINMLEKMCRVCGKIIKISKGYLNPKKACQYLDVLTKFGVLEQEDPQIYPANLCITCKRKLEKIHQGDTKDLQIVNFYPHSDDCACFSSIRNQSFHVSRFDYLMREIGFTRYQNDLIYFKPVKDTATNVIDVPMQLIITPMTNKWKIFVHGKIIQRENHCTLQHLPEFVNNDNMNSFCEQISKLTVCQGNRNFESVLNNRVKFDDPFPGKNGSTAYAESAGEGHTRLIAENFRIIRSSDCSYLISGNIICEPCCMYRNTLHKFKRRVSDDTRLQASTSDDSHTNLRYLNIEELRDRLRNVSAAKKAAVDKAARYASKIDNLVKSNGVTVDGGTHILLKDVLCSESTSFQEGTPQWLLWEQQQKQASKCDSRGMRWHPLIIRWCLSIYHSSPAAYRQIASKRNKFLILPHVNTLKKYLNFTQPLSDFNPDIIERLIEDSKVEELCEWKRNVALLFDEIKIKSGLVYQRSNGKLVGFTEMGDVNEEIQKFQREIENDDTPGERDLATYVNVFMMRSICTSIPPYPFGYHAGLGFTADQLFPLVWDATRVLESIGFKVRAWVCDGATPNRKFFQINQNNTDIFWTWNNFDPSRKIYFISDVPHLMKTTRNNFENSHGNRHSRNLHVDHQDISWQFLESLYEWDLGMNRAAFGFRYLLKITEDHIKLSPRLRMKVNLAAQVMSNSVALALEHQRLPNRESTIKFIKIFDRAFDCLNVSSTRKDGKPDRRPFTSVDDERYEFLEQVLEYLDEWRCQANHTIGLTKEEKSKLCISYQTDHSWHMTIKSFITLSKTLLMEGVPYILSEKFYQDPLEELFARHRRAGGCSDNPTLEQFERQEISLNVVKSELIGDLRGNTAGRPDTRPDIDITDTRLPRKRQKIIDH